MAGIHYCVTTAAAAATTSVMTDESRQLLHIVLIHLTILRRTILETIYNIVASGLQPTSYACIRYTLQPAGDELYRAPPYVVTTKIIKKEGKETVSCAGGSVLLLLTV